ncbi:MAG: hypothetical protein PHV11_08485, partial [Candidatus Bipolaricaulis sp.]|nr:hypothetical protein [Candidatus Bipolaricaulis sp.]
GIEMAAFTNPTSASSWYKGTEYNVQWDTSVTDSGLYLYKGAVDLGLIEGGVMDMITILLLKIA